MFYRCDCDCSILFLPSRREKSQIVRSTCLAEQQRPTSFEGRQFRDLCGMRSPASVSHGPQAYIKQRNSIYVNTPCPIRNSFCIEKKVCSSASIRDVVWEETAPDPPESVACSVKTAHGVPAAGAARLAARAEASRNSPDGNQSGSLKGCHLRSPPSHRARFIASFHPDVRNHPDGVSLAVVRAL